MFFDPRTKQVQEGHWGIYLPSGLRVGTLRVENGFSGVTEVWELSEPWQSHHPPDGYTLVRFDDLDMSTSSRKGQLDSGTNTGGVQHYAVVEDKLRNVANAADLPTIPGTLRELKQSGRVQGYAFHTTEAGTTYTAHHFLFRDFNAKAITTWGTSSCSTSLKDCVVAQGFFDPEHLYFVGEFTWKTPG